MAESTYRRRQQQHRDFNVDRPRQSVLPDHRVTTQAANLLDNRLVQRAQRPNTTGLPDNLKHGIESLSGMNMDNVNVHLNSSKPAQLNAHAYAQGTDIHVAPGQEKHLPHEAWHVVQQAQGRVKPTMQMKPAQNIPRTTNGRLINLPTEISGNDSVRGTQNILQFARYTWNASKGKWDSDGQASSSSAPSPKATGDFDGQIFDDTTGTYTSQEQVGSRKQRRMAKAKAQTVEHGGAWSQDKFLQTAKVGLELTFSNASTNRFFTNEGIRPAESREATRFWGGLCDTLNGASRSTAANVFTGPAKKNKSLGGSEGELPTYRVEYRGKGSSDIIFWWVISIDPSVVEIQTMPVPTSSMQHDPIKEFIEDIYRWAEANDLKPGDGGGHINVDFATGLKGDYRLVPRLIWASELLAIHLKKLKQVVGSDEEEEETPSLVEGEPQGGDPFISDHRMHVRHTDDFEWRDKEGADTHREKNHSADWHDEVYRKVGSSVRDLPSMIKFREAHGRWLHAHPTVRQYLGATEKASRLTTKADADGLKKVLHYQAINIDHLFDEIDEKTGEDPRRVEFRMFAAQRTIEDIVQCVIQVAQILARASATED